MLLRTLSHGGRGEGLLPWEGEDVGVLDGGGKEGLLTGLRQDQCCLHGGCTHTALQQAFYCYKYKHECMCVCMKYYIPVMFMHSIMFTAMRPSALAKLCIASIPDRICFTSTAELLLGSCTEDKSCVYSRTMTYKSPGLI